MADCLYYALPNCRHVVSRGSDKHREMAQFVHDRVVDTVPGDLG
jgi:hypothetical protein